MIFVDGRIAQGPSGVRGKVQSVRFFILLYLEVVQQEDCYRIEIRSRGYFD